MLRYLAAALTAALLTASAQAQETMDSNSCKRAWDQREMEPVRGLISTVAVSRSASLRLNCDVITIYFRYSNWDKDSSWKPGDRPLTYYFARIVSLEGSQSTTRWADSRSCPPLTDVLRELIKIQPPPIDIPGMKPPSPDPITIQLDGDGFRLWNKLGSEFSGNQSSALGQWTYAAVKNLTHCWKEEAPSFSWVDEQWSPRSS